MDALTIALRALAEPANRRGTRRAKAKPQGWPRRVLILDAETTADAVQQLNFLAYRCARWRDDGTLDVREAGLVYADDLPDRYPSGYAALVAYAQKHPAEVGPGAPQQLQCISRSEFVKRVLWQAVEADALIVGFNLPFDLSRLALECGEGRSGYRGGFSFALWQYRPRYSKHLRDDPHRPHLCIKHLDSARAFIGFNRLPGRRGHQGYFLDLKTLAFALTGDKQSLAKTCRAFGVEHGKTEAERHGVITEAYIDYNRRDVQATQELLEKLRAEFDRHPIQLDPWQAYSPASLAKGYLDAMGIRLPSGVPQLRQSQAMLAYYGGRAECRVRLAAVPVRHVDFMSMYPTVNTHMGLFRLLTAERLRVRDATADVRALLANLTLDQCFDSALWPQLAGFALVQPNADIFPLRARYGEGEELTIGVNQCSSKQPLWFALPDVVASALLTGHPPKVLKAWRLVPHGQQRGLRPVKLRGQEVIDPRTDDFFKRVVELRKRTKRAPDLSTEERDRLALALKIIANSGSYGIFAELNRTELAKSKRIAVRIHGLGGAFEQETHAPEEPGAFFFPPLAALITAGARLMLAILERCVQDAGGTFAFTDTDSMAIVATKRGGALAPRLRGRQGPPRRALSWAEGDAIVERFAALNPFNPSDVPGSVLELKEVNFGSHGRPIPLWCFVISAKRYTFLRGVGTKRLEIVEPSEHGLGHLLNPKGADAPHDRAWITEVWEWIVRLALGLEAPRPAWWDQPAVSRVGVTSPHVYGPFAKGDGAAPYAQRVKPFNFLLSASIGRLGHPPGVNPQRCHLVLPYTTNPSDWLKRPWTDLYSHLRYRIGTGPTADARTVHVKTFGDVISEYATHPESKSGDVNGAPCTRSSTGLLTRRHVRVARVVYVGKEANRLEEEVDAGLIHSIDEVQAIYHDPDDDTWARDVRPLLKALRRADLARLAGITPRAIQLLRNGRRRPSPETETVLVRAARREAHRLVSLKSTDPDLRGCAERLLATALARTPSQGRRPPRERKRRARP
jgi:hypothetical protein